VDNIGDIWTSNNKVEKAPNKMTIARWIRERITTRSMKMNIEFNGSLNSALIIKTSTSNEILNILFL
jgi:hypothetical protein